MIEAIERLPEQPAPWYAKHQIQCGICLEREAWCKCDRESIRMALRTLPARYQTVEVEA